MESRVDHRLGLQLGVSHHSISRSGERKSASRRSGQCAVLYQEPWALGRGVTGVEKEGQRGAGKVGTLRAGWEGLSHYLGGQGGPAGLGIPWVLQHNLPREKRAVLTTVHTQPHSVRRCQGQEHRL